MADAKGKDQPFQAKSAAGRRSRQKAWLAEVSPKPSRFFSFFSGLAASRAASVKMSAGALHRQVGIGKEHLDLFRAQTFDVEGGG
jgi:hypothetical protein